MDKLIALVMICISICGSNLGVASDNTTNSELTMSTTYETKSDAIDSKELAEDCLEELSDMLEYDAVEIDKPFDGGKLEKVCTEIEYASAINIDDMIIDLYPTFINQEEALDRISVECGDILQWLKKEYSLKPFSINTWHDYRNVLFAWDVNEVHWTDEEWRQIDLLDSFFDIYENEDENNEIIDELETISEILEDAEAPAVDKIQECEMIAESITLSLPESNERVELRDEIADTLTEYNERQNDESAGATFTLTSIGYERKPADISGLVVKTTYSNNSKFNVTKGVNYATKYANSANSSGYGYILGQDCTNFTSQIKHEGGVPFYKTYKKDGWSHWKEHHAQGEGHEYSSKWVGADSFVKFFGVKNKYTSGKTAFTNMSKAVKKGSFIAYDKVNDGSWDHVGFVTRVYDRKEYYPDGKKTYTDFKIAQHSSDYHLNVSHKDNGWDKTAQNNSKFACGIVN